MRALVSPQYGPPEQFTIADLPVPEPGPGQLRVRVAAASINPADLLMSGGGARTMIPVELPYVLGTDFAGTVDAVGPGSERPGHPGEFQPGEFQPGDEVFGFGAPQSFATAMRIPAYGSGTIAEYAIVQADRFVARRPEGLSVTTAAALPSVGMTALAVLDALHEAVLHDDALHDDALHEDVLNEAVLNEEAPHEPASRAAAVTQRRTVLVVGAPGGIGSVLLPLLACVPGVTILATAGPAEEQFVRERGAAETYADRDPAALADAVLARRPDGIDAVVNLGPLGKAMIPLARALRNGGRFVNTTPGPPDASLFDRDDLVIATVMGTTFLTADTLPTLAGLVVDGTIPDLVTRTVPLTGAATAYNDLRSPEQRTADQRTIGKTVIEIR